jgi:hypothetical protein
MACIIRKQPLSTEFALCIVGPLRCFTWHKSGTLAGNYGSTDCGNIKPIAFGVTDDVVSNLVVEEMLAAYRLHQ